MGFKLPSALAGDDGEVEMDEEGAREVLRLIGGTALGAGILAVGGMIFNRVSNLAGTNSDLGDLY